MALNEIYDLDATSPNSNSNFAGNNFSEGMAPSIVNNGVRALASMIRRAVGYQSAAISSSVSTNIFATGTGNYMHVIGANAINSFGPAVAAGTWRILEFESSASLSHSTNLILKGNVARRTQPGDVGLYISEGSGNIREAFYDGQAGNFTSLSTSVFVVGGVQQFPRTTFLAHKNGSPQGSISSTATPITFGTESFDIGSYFASDAWTPPAGHVRISAQIQFTGTNGVDGEALQISIFQDGVAVRTMRVLRSGTSDCGVGISGIFSTSGTNVYTIQAVKTGAGVGTIEGATTATWFCGELI